MLQQASIEVPLWVSISRDEVTGLEVLELEKVVFVPSESRVQRVIARMLKAGVTRLECRYLRDDPYPETRVERTLVLCLDKHNELWGYYQGMNRIIDPACLKGAITVAFDCNATITPVRTVRA
jgi:hypothetical protein